MKSEIKTSQAPQALGPYSQGTRGSGEWLFVSGQTPLDPETMVLVGVDAAAQAHQCLKNVMAILAASGAGPEHVTRTTVYLKDMDDFAAVNAVYATYFPAPYPARACVQVCRLPKDALVEIDAIALV
ncbi:MAG: RidA family protein [Clostridiales bacterium]|nr:RidA family protein [Clostridiales bacterium]